MAKSKYLCHTGEGKIFENSYGTYTVQTAEIVDSNFFSAGTSYCLPGKSHDTHTHPDQDEIILYPFGTGIQTVGDESFEISNGDMVFIPAGIPHSTTNTGVNPLPMIIIKSNHKGIK